MCFLWAPSHPSNYLYDISQMPQRYFQIRMSIPNSWSSPLSKIVWFFPVFPSSKNCITIHPFNFINQIPRIPSYSLPLPSIQSIFKPCHFMKLLLHGPLLSTSTLPSQSKQPVCHVDNCVSFLPGLATPTWFPLQSDPQSDLSKTQTLSYYALLKTLWRPHKTLTMKANMVDEARRD